MEPPPQIETPPPAAPRPDEPDAAAAGRAFARALARDIRRLGSRLARRPLRRAADPHRRRQGKMRGAVAGTLRILLALGAFFVMAGGALLAWALYDMPLDEKPAEAAPRIVIQASDGREIGSRGGFKLDEAALSDFPAHLVAAVLSAEDRAFFRHPGIDLRAIARALNRNLSAGEVVEGGSTITQQLAKLMLGDDEQTLRRKLREAVIAVWLELRFGKQAILTRYLNSVYMGSGAYGMPAAAAFYFNKDVGELTVQESALLAGLIRAPSQLNPLHDLKAARARAAIVLDAMVETGALSAAAAAAAKAAPAALNPAHARTKDGTWFADWIATEAADFAMPGGTGIAVRTTLMPALQRLAEDIVRDVLARHGGDAGASEAALVALRPDGAVVAMVGGRDYARIQFNRATQALRQPGSAFKLFVYLAALRTGFRLDDTVEDAPLVIDEWSPENFGGRYFGRVRLADAFANSLNTATVRLAMAVGIDKVIAAARDLGVDAPLRPVPSVALGTSEVTLLDLTAAYASVRAGWMPVEPWGIEGFGSAEEGSMLFKAAAPKDRRRPLDHREELTTLLRSVVERGTGRAAASVGPAAGKTGTSQNYRDAWFVGFDDRLVVGVWVGNDDGRPMNRVTGGSIPVEIWRRFMSEARPMLDTGPRPPDMPAPVVPPPEAPSGESLTIVAGQGGVCDHRACAAKYRSFRPSDCSYQPYGGGPRRFCDAGASAGPPAATADAEVEAAPDRDPGLVDEVQAASAGFCNVAACSAAYASFRPSDCTYQPFDGGPRRYCRK